MAQGTLIQLGGLKISTLVVGIMGSVVIHGAVLTGSYLVITSRPSQEKLSAQPLYARGEPIQIRLIEADMKDVVPDEPGLEVDPNMTTLDEVETPTEAEPEEQLEPREVELDPVDPNQLVLPEPIVTEKTESSDEAQGLPPDMCAVLLERLAQTVEMLKTHRPEPTRIAPTPKTTLVKKPESAAPRVNPTRTQPPAPSAPAQAGVENGAEAMNLPKPVYPSRSIRRGHEGIVLVEVEIRANGSIGDVRLHTGSGHRLLDKAAVEAARKGRFEPATRDGVPFSSRMVVPFEFRLK